MIVNYTSIMFRNNYDYNVFTFQKVVVDCLTMSLYLRKLNTREYSIFCLFKLVAVSQIQSYVLLRLIFISLIKFIKINMTLYTKGTSLEIPEILPERNM